NAGLSFVEYNALNVQFLEFEMPPKVENAIFTSQYAIDAVFSKYHEKKPLFRTVFV
ncbi:MAG: hypothetical protein HKN48_00320, partial [Flavobacteriaceae bacterium]|nr:hypothetical protein [Flavobacteriaceae bacterium]